jgi:hypothetical protein
MARPKHCYGHWTTTLFQHIYTDWAHPRDNLMISKSIRSFSVHSDTVPIQCQDFEAIARMQLPRVLPQEFSRNAKSMDKVYRESLVLPCLRPRSLRYTCTLAYHPPARPTELWRWRSYAFSPQTRVSNGMKLHMKLSLLISP